MGSVSSVNPGVQDLLQTLSNVDSPVLSSSKAVSALQSASPSDIVQLSMEATQLEGIDTMFGMTNTASSTADPILASLENLATGSNSSAATGSSGASTTTSAATRALNSETALQAAETQALFGAGNTDPLANSLFSTTA